ncbi:group I truncated hemoglobin [Brevundimonas sp.]|uniref:group I truncated hemoglobin n=1 Tax=Brevundimonas sp. TaxID=1871086 RepID=UPI003BAC45BD
MIRSLLLAACLVGVSAPALAQEAEDDFAPPPIVMSSEHPDEEAVEPYERSNAHAGATPFEGAAMFEAFHGAEGVSRIVDDMVARSIADPRISPIFAASDLVRLRRTLKEQFCYMLGGGCDYSGMAMASSHADLGLQSADMGALVENLQHAMAAEGVPFATQNRFLGKLAPMKGDVVTR